MTTVEFDGQRYPIREGESVLDALLRGGATIPFSCRKGTCHTCMHRVVLGDAGTAATEGLSAAQQEAGYFLPCQSHPQTDLVMERPRPGDLFVTVRVEDVVPLSPSVVRIRMEPERVMHWRAGQHVQLRRPDGLVRSYSLASIPEEDYFLEIHVKRVPGGAMSEWLADTLQADDTLEVQGPVGTCFYQPPSKQTPLLLVGSGTGLAPLLGVVRDALRLGHEGPIELYHGARTREGLYHSLLLEELARANPQLRYTACLSGEVVQAPIEHGDVAEIAFRNEVDRRGWQVYLCGNPEMVADGRVRAVKAGIDRDNVFVDPFEPSTPYAPQDREKIDRIAADPEMWEALKQGDGLTEILTDFYEHVFADALLSPFFHKITKKRAIEKQYEFLRDLFTGARVYFGMRPFNAHHWMVISDKLFDYREALFERSLRKYGLAESLIHRWLSLHELFRRELVKSSQRGLIVDGVEQLHDGFEDLDVTVGTLCNGCEGEISPGDRARYHKRTGELFCERCMSRRTQRPTA